MWSKLILPSIMLIFPTIMRCCNHYLYRVLRLLIRRTSDWKGTFELFCCYRIWLMKNNFKSLLCSACYEMKVRTRGTKLTKKNSNYCPSICGRYQSKHRLHCDWQFIEFTLRASQWKYMHFDGNGKESSLFN